ncbi:MAG: LysR family transcriptional regulator [Rhodospirillales bacterium]|nr:LysR family transcriptional regulator [Rhodospirillales bacterium]
MQRLNLAAVDLNLLVVFDAIMAERSVTRAAECVRLTQPAVSHALSRLRTLFRDPLFVRTPAGMEPTPLALGLGPRIAAVLHEVGAILAPDQTFDPGTSDRIFSVGMSDYAASVFLPALARRIQQLAPGVTVVSRHTNHAEGIGLLDAGDAELVVGNFPDPPQRLQSELLFHEVFLCALRAGHPALAGTFDLDAYLRCSHLNVSLRGEPVGYVDRVLARSRRRRKVTLVAGHFLVAPDLVAATDLVATEPARVLSPAAGRLGLKLRDVPFRVPGFAVVQMWPRRLDTDRGHAWLRSQVKAAGTSA